ncbi:spore germination protein [Bacillus swezeyi]|uniref:spore germination protein n=1 Tax=Bacillus swezeyi TaxID=1925020 RepID=UPI0039C6A55C
MKHCCSVYIHHVGEGGIVNFGGAYRISPITMEKIVEGAGGPNTGLAASDFFGGQLSPAVDEETITEES